MNSIFEAAGLRVFERGWLSSNSALFVGGGSRESVLIDSGYHSHATQTVALVRRALGSRSLDRIVNTHLHSDHCGGNHALQAAFGCAIDVPAGESDKVDRWDEARLTFRDTGQACPRFRRTGSIRDGDTVQCGPYAWRALSAPGHDPESLVFYQSELELLISADALWENGFGVVFPELEGEDGFEDVHRTLDRLAVLPVRWVIPGHGAPFQGFKLALDRAYRRLDAFIADPARHSRHAVKVLIKFHLLEFQQCTVAELLEWLKVTRFVQLSHSSYFPAVDFGIWCAGLIKDLSASNAIALEGRWIRNL